MGEQGASASGPAENPSTKSVLPQQSNNFCGLGRVRDQEDLRRATQQAFLYQLVARLGLWFVFELVTGGTFSCVERFSHGVSQSSRIVVIGREQDKNG